MLSHLNWLHDERKRVKEGKKGGKEKSNRLRAKQTVTEENGVIDVSVQMKARRKSHSFPRCG